MLKRREFLKRVGAATTVALAFDRGSTAQANDESVALHFISERMEVELSAAAPQFVMLNVDGLGKGRRGPNIVGASAPSGKLRATSHIRGNVRRVEYRAAAGEAEFSPAAWTFEFSGSRIVLTSKWSQATEPGPVTFLFNLKDVHSTVLGVVREDKLLALPALLHFPGQGSMRLTSSASDLGLTYKSADDRKSNATLALPGATADRRHIVYTLEVVAIYPNVNGIEGDSRFDAFRRNWLNALQLNPEFPALANNTASDTCAFCYYEYADIAARTPPLVEGLTALDVVGQTLNRILAGGTVELAYGLPSKPWTESDSPFSDTFPSMLIAAGQCVLTGNSDRWLAANYDGIRGWAEAMLHTDASGNGLVKYSISGNSGIWNDATPTFRPSNWWDTIGFGHEDAYANALAYRALGYMAMMSRKVGRDDDARRYESAAAKLRENYYREFFDPTTGVLAGWKSADGKLHDYYFLWVNGAAIHYGLVPIRQANAIMDKLMEKMREVGYDSFNMGLPGNLVSVALDDCVDKRGKGRFGCGTLPNNSDGFQKYENGGATGAFSFFTLAALYDLGRREEADKILFAMLGEYDRCGFENRGANGMSNDWRQWDGTPSGSEGFLTDSYYALLAVLLRQANNGWRAGFRPVGGHYQP